MMIQPLTHDILKNFSGISKSILIREGNKIRTMSPERTVFVEAVVEDVFPREFGVYDLPSFLSVLSLFPTAEIVYEDKYLQLTDGRRRTRFHYSNPRHIKAPPAGELNLPPTLMSFVLDKDEIENMLKASSVMKLTNLHIHGNRVVCKTDEGVSNDYELTIDNVDIAYDVDADTINAKIDIKTLRFIPGNYKVLVSSKAVVFESQDLTLKYIFMLNA